MKCIHCGYRASWVVRTERRKDNSTLRRHECLQCKYRFSTEEYIKQNIDQHEKLAAHR